MNSKILQNIQIEVDASYLYKVLADNEDDANVAHVFNEMSEIEKSHATLTSFVFFAWSNYPSNPIPFYRWFLGDFLQCFQVRLGCS